MTEEQINIISKFKKSYFNDFDNSEISDAENQIIETCLTFVRSRFSAMKYILGTALDFCLLAQSLSNHDPELKEFRPDFSEKELFERYQLVKSRGARKANTLSLSFESKKEIGIRKIEEDVLLLFHRLNRTDYPSAYVYNTGQWQKYTDLLEAIFKLGESARYKLVDALITFGLNTLKENTYYERSEKRKRLFEEIITEFERGNPDENGGLIFQTIAYAYYQTDYPHLSIVTDKVRTGSSRQRRFGDIDCYYGLDLEISVEVKDFLLDLSNFEQQLGNLISNVSKSDVVGIAFVKEVDSETIEILGKSNVQVLTEASLLDRIKQWDFQKQEYAVNAMLHYLAHIEQDAGAVQRLLEFIALNDSRHPSLFFLKIQKIEDSSEES